MYDVLHAQGNVLLVFRYCQLSCKMGRIRLEQSSLCFSSSCIPICLYYALNDAPSLPGRKTKVISYVVISSSDTILLGMMNRTDH